MLDRETFQYYETSKYEQQQQWKCLLDNSESMTDADAVITGRTLIHTTNRVVMVKA